MNQLAQVHLQNSSYSGGNGGADDAQSGLEMPGMQLFPATDLLISALVCSTM